MKQVELTRVFKFNATALPDPSPAMSAEEVQQHYANTYPALTNGSVSAPKIIGNELVYTMSASAGTLG